MYKFTVSLTMLLMFFFLGGAYAQKNKAIDTSLYELYISDEFDGNQLDTNRWYRFHPRWYWDSLQHKELGDDDAASTRLFYGYEDATAVFNQVYMDSNVVISDGTCKLRTFKKEATWRGYTRGYTSGMIHSTSQIGGPGLYEIRARVSGAYLYTFAFWLFGNNPIDSKPLSSEIDIFEYFNRKKNSVESNLHFWDTGRDIAKKHFDRRLDQENWHVYRCIFDSFAVRMYVDDMDHPWCTFYAFHDTLTSQDVTYSNFEKIPRDRWVANKYFPYTYHHFQVIISGGTTRTPRMIRRNQWQNNRTADYGEMELDYFRYYRLKNPN